MKNKYVFVTVLLLAIALAGAGFVRGVGYIETQEDEEELLIVTSFYPMYVATLNVAGGGGGVQVENLSEPQTGCLHDFQLTPQDMRLLTEADVFVVNGGGMESFLSEVAAEYPHLTVIEAGAGIFETEDDTESDLGAEDSHGHNHGENAHVWMSTRHYMEQITAIRNGLMQKDPANCAYYEEQAANYLSKIEALQKQIQCVKPYTEGQPVILFHEAFEYLCEDYGLLVEGVLNLDEERQISAGEVADLIALIEEKKIEIILAEDLYGRDMGDTIEKETDCKVYYLNPLNRGGESIDSWLEGMEENLNILTEAFAPGEAAAPGEAEAPGETAAAGPKEEA